MSLTAGQGRLTKWWPWADLLLLTWSSGFMDALSYLRSGVFTANMTGNTVVFGLGMFGADKSHVLPCAVSLTSFTTGSVIAALVLVRSRNDRRRDLRVGVALELPFVIVFGLLWMLTPRWSLAVIATAACGLGIQSVAVRRLRISGVVTTFITGTITTAIVSLATARRPRTIPPQKSAGSPRLLVCMFASYIVAAAAGAALDTRHIRLVGVIPVATVGIVELRSRIAQRTNQSGA